MNKITDTDFLLTLPPALKQDEKMVALGHLVAEELRITAEDTKKNIIYADVDNLSETWLDTLAYDLHVDWYDYDYPIEIKRKLIKNSIRVHQKLGTRYAVQSVLQDVYNTAEVQEWFEYGGEPYTFKITVDIGREGLNEDTSREIERKMQFYKNLRSHCDGIFYILSIEKAKVKAVALHEVGTRLKVKPLLQNQIRAAGQNDIRAATYYGAILKVKAYIPSVLGAGTEAIGRIKAYQRSKSQIKISSRKEQ